MAADPELAQHHYFADLYSFDWKKLDWEQPLVSSLAVAACVLTGVLVGHPAAGLIAGGGAFTVGFGANQRIADSRIWPMLAAVATMWVSTMVGMLVGHRGFALIGAAAAWGFGYALLTTRANGVSWVGQQAAVFLLVTSAFPTNFRGAFDRAGLTVVGGLLQVLVTSTGLRLLPELGGDLLAVQRSVYSGITHGLAATLYTQRRETLLRLRAVALALPSVSGSKSFGFAVRMAITLVVACEMYRRLGLQSGYWIPMTALLVQKPAFFETLNRALMRVGGTLAGAVLASLFVTHVQPTPIWLALLVAVFAVCSYMTLSVNYGLYSLFLTSYIVFLLSLNTLPGPEIARRRALCTAAGGFVALVIHLDALRRHRAEPAKA